LEKNYIHGAIFPGKFEVICNNLEDGIFREGILRKMWNIILGIV